MMFIGTIVHLLEIILLSLLGIMVYKLVASYRKWKAMPVSSSAKGGDRNPRPFTPSQPQNPDYLSVSKITVTEEQSSHRVAEKTSSVILTDYIGEFFAETRLPDLEPYRSKSTEPLTLKVVSTSKRPAEKVTGTDQNKHQNQVFLAVQDVSTKQLASSDDEFIQVDVVSGARPTEVLEQAVPVLTEFADLGRETCVDDVEGDAYITVHTDGNHSRAANIMSDKVVMAMLEEARIVCAS
jgi:hypothetical protein